MATLYDIATKAGLSAPTVSRILNPRPGRIPAKKETIEKVRRIANELDYFPNAIARSLITNRSGNIGIIVDAKRDSDIECAFWWPIISGILHACYEQGYNCMIDIQNYEDIEEFELPKKLRGKLIDGLIITHPIGKKEDKILNAFLESGYTFVVLSTVSIDPRIWSVGCDSSSAYRKALLHLVELGHKKIGYSVHPIFQTQENRSMMFPSEELLNTFKNIKFVPIEIDRSVKSQVEEAHRLAESILRGDINVSAIIISEIIAAELINILNRNKINIPKDLSIIGTDDTFVCQITTPKLTTLTAPLSEMGSCAIDLLEEAIRAKNTGINLPARHVTLNKDFVVRDSTSHFQNS